MRAVRINLIRGVLGLITLCFPLLFNSCSGGFKSYKSDQSSALLSQPVSFDRNAIPQFAKTSVTVMGKCLRGRPIKLFVDGVSAGPDSTCDGGLFSAEVALLGDDGLKQIIVSQFDISGREIQDSVSVNKDTQAPAVALVTVTRLATPAGAYSLTGTCEAGVDLSISGDIASLLTGAACVNGVFQVTANLSPGDGVKNLVVQQTDKAGNVGQGTMAHTVDTMPPVLTVAAPQMNAVFKDSVTISGTCETGLRVVAAGAGLSAPVEVLCSAGNYSLSAALSAGDGPKEILLSHTDAQANKAEQRLTVVRDTTSPRLTIVAPAMGAVVRANVTLNGTCENGLNVQISSAALSQAQTIACNNSAFSAALNLSGADGSVTITAAQTDAAGNSGSAAVTVVKDTVAPLLVLSTPAPNSFAMNTVVAAGTCESGLPVMVSGAGVAQPGQIACTAGAFSATLTLSAGDGAKPIVFMQTDAAGNSSQVSVTITKDTVAPVLTVTAPANNATFTTESIAVNGACETGVPVSIGGTGAASALQLGCVNSAFSGTLVLSAGNGTKALEFRQTDAAGNSVLVQRSVSLSVPATVLAITAPAANSFNRGTLSLQGVCESNRTVSISGDVSANSSVTCVNAAFTAPVTLSAGDGLKTVRISQIQSTGMTAMDSRSFTKDTVAPAVLISQPAANSAFQASLSLSGTCESGLSVTIDGSGVLTAQTATCASGAFTATVTLSAGDGSKIVNVAQTDAAGNRGSATRTFLRDNAGPNLTITAPAAGTTASQGLTLQGACEGGNPVQISGSGVAAAVSVSCVSSAYSAAITFSTGEGAKAVSVAQADSAGNSTTVNRQFNKDSVAPTIAFTAPAAGTAAAAGVTLNGSCESGLTVQISGGVSANTSVSCANSAFTANITFSSGEGAKTITVAQTDAAGNTGSASRGFVRDSVAPVVTIAQPASGAFVRSPATVSGLCEAGIPVVLYGSGVATQVTVSCSAGMYSGSVTLTAGDGAKEIRAGQTDAAQNFGVAVVNVALDTVAPNVAIQAPEAGTLAPNGLTVSGACESGLPVVAGGSGAASMVQVNCTNAVFSVNVVFSATDGQKQISVTQTDAAGNTRSDTRVFERGDPVVKGTALYTAHCAICHGPLATSTKLGRTAAQISGAITTIPAMQNLATTLTAKDIEYIAAALGQSTSVPVSGSTAAVIPIGTRTYMASVFTDIFVDPASTATANTTIRNLINSHLLNRPSALGGPCRRYDDVCPEQSGARQASETWDMADAWVLPAATPLREGYITRACNEILAQDLAVTNVLKRAGNLTATAPASDANVGLVYGIFHLGFTVPSSDLTNLKAIHAGALSRGMSTTDAWRFTILAICQSPGTETL